jgi:hypothetical protein
MVRVMNEVNKEVKIHLVVMGVGPVSDQLESVKVLFKNLIWRRSDTLSWTERTDVLILTNLNCIFRQLDMKVFHTLS